MKRRILWLLVCMLLCTTMAACARREAPQLPTAEVQTQPETPEPTQETCVAECVHWALTLLSAGIFFLWRSGWAALLWLVYNVLGNVSFIVIQRYNRPRLQKLAEKTRRKPV